MMLAAQLLVQEPVWTGSALLSVSVEQLYGLTLRV